MPYAPAPSWDLDVLFPGGPAGATFEAELEASRAATEALVARADALTLADPPAIRATLREMEALGVRLGELRTFAACAFAADTTNQVAQLADLRTAEVANRFNRAGVPLSALLADADDDVFEALIDESLADRAPSLRHQRSGARTLNLRPKELQALASDMEREALHGWGQLYDHVSGHLTAKVDLPDQGPQTLGIAVVNGMRGHADERVRRAAYDGAHAAWSEQADLCAMALNHLTGGRQTRFDRLGVSPLAPTLHENRVDEGVIDAMWAAAEHARPKLVAYLHRKAALLGKPKLDAWDLLAPMPDADKSISWDRAQDVVVDAFAGLDPAMADFARRALAARWVDAEARPGRMPGGFCSPLPKSQQSRIFLTFTDTVDTMLTLAHELGHAYHDSVLFTQPPARREVTMALAETASTFAEAVVRDAALREAPDRNARLQLLDQDIQAGVAFLMNIPTRFAFEKRLFELRREGPLRADVLSAEMVTALRHHHGDALATWDDLFWASKLHFYISHFGFYNWSYTFGYLFSGAVYARARAEGPAFNRVYRDLLARTGWDDTRSIGREVLGEDLGDATFWIGATRPLLASVDAFLAETAG